MTAQEKREAAVVEEYGVYGIAYDTPENGEEKMSKHTPGPWTFAGMHPYGWGIRVDDVWIGTAHNNHTGEDARPQGDFPSNKEGEANAHLIAAAPDLLAALKEATGALCQCCVRLNPQHKEAFEQGECGCTDMNGYRAAIAKAEIA